VISIKKINKILKNTHAAISYPNSELEWSKLSMAYLDNPEKLINSKYNSFKIFINSQVDKRKAKF
jgi:hypothetical protein